MKNKELYLTILGLNYTQHLSKDYDKIKELLRKLLLKYTSFNIKDVVEQLKELKIEANYYSVLVAIKEIQEDCADKNIPLNVDILDIEIRTHDLPF